MGHPTQQLASATIEVAALGTPGQPNSERCGFPPNDPGPETAEDCQPIPDSYDPNDKQVAPTGMTAQHYTPTAVPLHYRVRLQSTGNDDACRVERGASSGLLVVAGSGGRGAGAQTFAVLDLSPADAVSVYPNPARSAAVLDWHHADFMLEQVRVYHGQGQLALSADLGNQPEPCLQLSFVGKPAGLYMLAVQASSQPVTRKIVLY